MVRRLYPNDPNARPLHAQNLHILLADDNKTRMLYEVHNAEFEPPSRRTHEVLWSMLALVYWPLLLPVVDLGQR